MLEYGNRRVEENTLDSLFEAVRLQPTNALALARLGAALKRENPAGLFRFTDVSRVLMDRARQLSNDPEVERITGQLK